MGDEGEERAISSKPACQPNRKRSCRLSCGGHYQGGSEGSCWRNIRCFCELQHRSCCGSDSPPSSTLRGCARQLRHDAIRGLQHCNVLLLFVQTHASSATNTVAWRAGLLDSGRFLIPCNGQCGALLAPVKHSVCLAHRWLPSFELETLDTPA